MPQKISQMTAAGSLTGDELVEVSVLSTSVTITAATISALASDNSFNDSANGFLAAGFAVGDQVRVQGFTGNVANNIFTGTVTSAAAGKLIIGGADGDVIVDDAAGESVTITKWETRRTTAAAMAGSVSAPVQCIPIACSDETTALTTGTAKVTFHMPFAFNLTGISAGVTAAPTGADIIVDVNEDTGGGPTSIMTTNKLRIDAGEFSTHTAGTPPALTDTALAAGSKITIDIDQVGSTIAGAGLKVYLLGRPA